ncbi:SMI1/KNR4 family protein [Flavobacterium ginsengisoli]|uniref:SMI1/KNR4 family protein n=1 Tax=Flavobacterium ginsengisoli TaxID=871694 RepID=UPI002414D598|nr:SMI1/KNR4 family protein [Flavobacterium ginsengisoli]
MTIQEIEKKYRFEYPFLYKQLEADGMLDVGEYGPNWYTDVYPTLKDNPPLLLHSYDFESLNLKSVAEEIEELQDPEDYRNINPEFKFIPFAKSGGGDHYCFFLNEENNGDVPIVFVWHDSNEVNYLAKNLQDFIFKVLLIDMSKQDVYNELTDEEFRDDIESVFKSHKKYLTEQTKRNSISYFRTRYN